MAFGTLTAKALEIIMLDSVRHALERVRKRRFSFESTTKEAKFGSETKMDFVTNVDRETQEFYLDYYGEILPDIGIIAEEGEFYLPCDMDRELHLVMDPIDGTSAFVRQQSHAISTMLALLEDGDEVIAAYIGDIVSREVYGFGPHTQDVYRFLSQTERIKLETDVSKPLSEQVVMIRRPVSYFSDAAQEVFAGEKSPYRSYILEGGSMGTQFARLWKGEIGGILLSTDSIAPWDLDPVVGITSQMGFVYLMVDPDTNKLRQIEVKPSMDKTTFEGEVLVVHESRLPEFEGLS